MPFQRRVHREDNLFDPTPFHTLDQLGDFQIVGADAIHGADDPMQHVIQTLVGVRLLERDQRERVLDHAEHGRVAAGMGTNSAHGLERKVLAGFAIPQTGLELFDRLAKTFQVLVFLSQQIKGEALGGFDPDARKLAEFLDGLLDGFGDERHC